MSEEYKNEESNITNYTSQITHHELPESRNHNSELERMSEA